MAEPLLLGAIADDHTGATDLAGGLREAGISVVQVRGERLDELAPALAGRTAVVVALKTRSVPPREAVEATLRAARTLRAMGARQLYFKYCSTFDSTAEGNIGPVTAALMEETGAPFTLTAPAFPANGRTQYLGHLFVDGALLSESPLRHHPVNPMTDANVVRHLQRQTTRRVGLVALPVVRAGAARVAAELDALAAAGVEIALGDAIEDPDLAALAEAGSNLPLLGGGSALAAALARSWVTRGLARPAPPWRHDADRAPVLMLAGSCSERTLEQIARFRATGMPALAMDVPAVLREGAAALDAVDRAAAEALTRAPAALIYSSMPPADRAVLLEQAARAGIDAEAARVALEHAAGQLAARFVARGGSQLVVAGGETSGAVMDALRVGALEIGPQVAPGVPICRTVGGASVTLALKSGNFGAPEFFQDCLRRLSGSAA